MGLFTQLREMIDAAENVDDLLTIQQAAEPGVLSKSEDAELTDRFQRKWASLKQAARERRQQEQG